MNNNGSFTFYIDSWSEMFVKQFIDNVKDSLNLSYNIFNVVDKINTINVYNSMPTINGYKLNFNTIAKYDMSVYNTEGLNVFETLYNLQTRPIRRIDIRNRIIYYLNELHIALEKHIKEHNTKCLIIFSPINATRIIASFVARMHNIPVVVLTESPFKNYYMLDRNYPYQIGSLSSTGFYKMIQSVEFNKSENEQYGIWLNNFFKDKETRGFNRAQVFYDSNELLDKNYLLIIGQSPTDANQIIHQRNIPYDPIALARNLKDITNDPIYFKPHPDDINNTHEALRSNHVTILKDMDVNIINYNVKIHDAIKGAKTVFTWNSNAGIEALVYYKKVVTLGESFYRNKNLTFDLNNYDDLQYLRDKTDIPTDDINHFLKFLICRFLIRENNSKDIANRINDLAFGEPKYGV